MTLRELAIPAVLVLACACGGDPDPGPAPVQAGVGLAGIDPDFEPYTDVNGSHVWDEGEPFEDKNNNGKLDTLWMGGFGQRQPTGIQDPLTVRATALRLGGDLYVFAAADTLGYGMGRVQAVKTRVVAALGADAIDPNRIFLASIHTHQAPDTVGVFGPEMQPAWDEAYLQKVMDGTVEAIVAAVADLKPAHLRVAHADGTGLARDIDEPVVLDPYVGILQAVDAADGEPISTMVTIANHPEAIWGDIWNWSSDLRMSPDFPHYLRTKIETELGGLALYFSADQGLMQTVAEIAPPGPERAKKVGEEYATRVIAALSDAPVLDDEDVAPTFGYDTAPVTLENFGLAMLVEAGIADGYKGYVYVEDGEGPCSGLGCMDLPLPVLRLGSKLTVFCVPAEVTPELVVGGIVAPTTYESEFPDAPPEPILMDHVKTPDRFFMGLCGSDVGYLYPKITANLNEVFDQQNGPGPSCAGTFLTALEKVLDDVNARAEAGGVR